MNFVFWIKFHIEGQGQSPLNRIAILTHVFSTFGPNLVMIAWTSDKLPRRQNFKIKIV